MKKWEQLQVNFDNLNFEAEQGNYRIKRFWMLAYAALPNSSQSTKELENLDFWITRWSYFVRLWG